jgi:hypothetical protein
MNATTISTWRLSQAMDRAVLLQGEEVFYDAL